LRRHDESTRNSQQVAIAIVGIAMFAASTACGTAETPSPSCDGAVTM
jgi:hypothetical protein